MAERGSMISDSGPVPGSRADSAIAQILGYESRAADGNAETCGDIFHHEIVVIEYDAFVGQQIRAPKSREPCSPSFICPVMQKWGTSQRLQHRPYQSRGMEPR